MDTSVIQVTDPSMCIGKRWGSYVTCLYVFIKQLYTLNVIGQIFLLNSFLGTGNLLYGFQIIKDLIRNKEWEKSGNFPRVTMCDFEVAFLIPFSSEKYLFMLDFFA